MYVNPYDIAKGDNEIVRLADLIQPDENGCFPDNLDDIEQMLADRLSEQYDGYESLCREYLNRVSNAAAIKAEEERLKKRREAVTASAEKLKAFMVSRLGEGCRTFGAFEFKSKKTPATLHYYGDMDEDKLIETLQSDYNGVYVNRKVKYSLDLTPLKKAIELKQIAVDGVELERGVSYSIK